jgi:hypothetical protein
MSPKNVACASALDPLDRAAIAYLTLPLVIFVLGWFEIWAALPLVACVAYALKPMAVPIPADSRGLPITRLQLTVAIAVGCAWSVCGGTGHVLFANPDWHLRDAVLHDLVAGRWPVGYGALNGYETMLRAPLGYYLPAALLGKWSGLRAAHFAIAAWTAVGATLFLLQVLSLTPARIGAVLTTALVIVFFSGFDIIGSLLHVPHFIAHWGVTRHLEWWAGSYQYSSMTTQLFWVPNHALGAWLAIGLLYRWPVCPQPGRAALDFMLPMLVVAVALWSPLAALGLLPFLLLRALAGRVSGRSARFLDPRVWAPALVVGVVVGAYLTLDAGRIPRSWTVGRSGSGAADIARDLLLQAEFFLLEAGFIGVAILAIRRSSQVALALGVLALLPLVSFGAANDFVMRVSIPSLAVLAIGASLALCGDGSRAGGLPTGAVRDGPPQDRAVGKKVLLGCLLAVGAVTPFQEFARAAALPSWPINLEATLIGAACGLYPAHYVARLRGRAVEHILQKVHPLPLGLKQGQACKNPAVGLMKERGLL